LVDWTKISTPPPRLFSMNIRRIAIRFFMITGIVLASAVTWLYYAAPFMIVKPVRVGFTWPGAGVSVPTGEKVQFISRDSTELHGYWAKRPGQAGRATVILLHGINNRKESWLPTALWLQEQGFDALLLDHRGHGESGGDYCTFGYREKEDVAAAVDFIQQQQPDVPVGVWGNSLGGAVALQALAHEPRLRFGIVQSTFATFRDVVYDYQVRMFRLPSRWLANNAIDRAAALAHFPPDSIRPAAAARHIVQPMLMAHGDADRNINCRYGQEIFQNLASGQKEFHLIAGADHHNVGQRGGAQLRADILAFLQRHSAKN
jgi:uncharacterized protein